MKRFLILISALAFFVSFTFLGTHHDGYKKAYEDEPPPSGTTIVTD